MSGGLFRAPPVGIGADTGVARFRLQAEQRARSSVCQYEATDGRRQGALLLTVAVSGGPGYLGSSYNGAAALEELSFPAWADGGYSLLGSLVLETQVGAVRKTLVADLSSGTYQLPPCDAVQVGAVLYNMELTGAYDVTVQAAVTPGESASALPLVYTQQSLALVPMSGNDTIVRKTFPRPPHAHGFRGQTQLVGPTPTQNCNSQAIVDMSRYLWEMSVGPFAPVLPWTEAVSVRFVCQNSLIAPSIAAMLAAQWRVDP